MKSVKGYTMEYYRLECQNEGGEVFEFENIEEAAKHLSAMTGISIEDCKDGIENDTNCDWIVFENGKVYFRYYGVNYNKEYIDQIRENHSC